jgi:hypothetical protein
MSFENRFGFSLSRESIFDSCRRRYYFHYYLSWGGWEQGAPSVVREAFRLKRLVSLPLWRGQLIHYVTSKVLQSMKAKGRIPERDKVEEYILERFRKQLGFSSAGRYRTEPKKHRGKLVVDWLALFEHEYERPLRSDRLDQTKEECLRAIEGLYESPLLVEIEDTDPDGWEIEDLDRAEFSQHFSFEGVTVYAKTDLIYRGNDGTCNIVDWKTYRAPQDERADAGVQLGIYGYFALMVKEVPLESIRLYEVNLLDEGRVKRHSIGEAEIERSTDHIRRGISKLSSVLVDGDVARNEARAPEQFPKIENGSCRFCNFYRICKDESNPHRLP